MKTSTGAKEQVGKWMEGEGRQAGERANEQRLGGLQEYVGVVADG